MTVSQDAFHNGAFHLLQPTNGAHRAGMDALLLAACAPTAPKLRDGGYKVADFGAGCGVVGFACANRCETAQVDLIELDSEMAALARQSLALPENQFLTHRLKVVEHDISDLDASGFPYHLVLSNPPFNDESHRSSPNAQRKMAHKMSDNLLEKWINSAKRSLTPRGHLVFIVRPASLPEMLQNLGQGFGSVVLLPVLTKPEKPANRILIAARKGGRGALKILPDFVVHKPDGTFTAQADAVFKGKAGIDLF